MTLNDFFRLYADEPYDAVIITDENGAVDKYYSLKRAFPYYDGNLIVAEHEENSVEGEPYELYITLEAPAKYEPDTYRSLGLCAANYH